MPRPSFPWKGSCAALALLWVGCQAGSTGEGTRALAGTGSDGAPGTGATGCGTDPIVIHDCHVAGGYEVDTYTPGAFPELYLIGIYHATLGRSPLDVQAAKVHVASGGPMVLALSAYERTHWTITADAGAVIERVILVGYYLQTATAPGGVAVESHSYDGGEFLDNYCGFDWPPEGRGCDQRPTPDCCTDVLIEMVEEYAGRKLTAFAGCNLASDFTVGCECPDLVCEAPAPLTIECAGPGGAEVADARIADWLDDATATGGCGALTIAHDAPAVFLSSCAGEPSPTVVTFTATDERGNTATCASNVTVLDTTAPRVALTQTAACLWPPSHAQVGVATVDVSDICDPDAAAVAVTASSDERTSTEIGAGGPAKCPDARLVDGVVELRAERAGPSGADNGRVYGAVGVSASDRCGNTAEAALPVGTAPGCPGAVCVPHDHDSQETCTAVDDGQGDATMCN